MQNENFKSAITFVRKFELSKRIAIMILIAYAFSVIMRLYWVFWAGGFPEFMWNNQLMINTNDGYAFAEGARDMIAGFHQPNDLSYFGSSLSTLTAYLAKILPFSFETIILYMSVFLSSLIVIPILLISSELKCIKAGFMGALVSSVANSYYNRTMAGYYDTDMLNLVFAMFILWAMIRIIVKNDKLCLLYITSFVMLYNWWYPSSFALNSTMVGIFLVYTLVFLRKHRLNYEAIILIIVALTNIPLYIQAAVILLLFAVFYFKNNLINLRILAIIGAIVFAIFVLKGGLNPIIFQLKFYIFRGVADSGGIKLHFYNVNQTIQESGIVPMKIFMERISSDIAVFIVAAVGYVILCFRHKEFLLSLPILGLGFIAFKAGLRFTIYSVPIMGLGFGYAIYFGVKMLKIPRDAGRVCMFFLTLAALYPAYAHIKEYKTSTVFYNREVEILNKLKSIASREDYVLAWWDYGYPIRYYADVKTLIDGGKHLGNDNFPISFALFKDQISSANMARMDVEYTERNFKEKIQDTLEEALKDYHYNDIDDLLLNLKLKDFAPPKPTRDVYYYLPDRMMSIFNVVLQFSNLDLKTGKNYDSPFFYQADIYEQDQYGINLGNGITLSNDLTSLRLGERSVNINTFYITSYDEHSKLSVSQTNIDSSAQFYVIFMKDYGRFLLLDKSVLNSTFIQLFVFERYDADLFEPVILSPVAKIYKLKR